MGIDKQEVYNKHFDKEDKKSRMGIDKQEVYNKHFDKEDKKRDKIYKVKFWNKKQNQKIFQA